MSAMSTPPPKPPSKTIGSVLDAAETTSLAILYQHLLPNANVRPALHDPQHSQLANVLRVAHSELAAHEAAETSAVEMNAFLVREVGKMTALLRARGGEYAVDFEAYRAARAARMAEEVLDLVLYEAVLGEVRLEREALGKEVRGGITGVVWMTCEHGRGNGNSWTDEATE